VVIDLTASTDAGVTFDKFTNCTSGCHSDGLQGGVAKIVIDNDAGAGSTREDGMICDAGNWCELTVA